MQKVCKAWVTGYHLDTDHGGGALIAKCAKSQTLCHSVTNWQEMPLPWLLKLFAQNGSVLPQKRSLLVLLSPIMVLRVSSTESMWPVQTNGSDLLKSRTRQGMFRSINF